ncbi:UNVERIFIED_CONTAM: hypothetical protein K2H54_017674 [Gekko kuhli]
MPIKAQPTELELSNTTCRILNVRRSFAIAERQQRKCNPPQTALLSQHQKIKYVTTCLLFTFVNNLLVTFVFFFNLNYTLLLNTFLAYIAKDFTSTFLCIAVPFPVQSLLLLWFNLCG